MGTYKLLFTVGIVRNKMINTWPISQKKMYSLTLKMNVRLLNAVLKQVSKSVAPNSSAGFCRATLRYNNIFANHSGHGLRFGSYDCRICANVDYYALEGECFYNGNGTSWQMHKTFVSSCLLVLFLVFY